MCVVSLKCLVNFVTTWNLFTNCFHLSAVYTKNVVNWKKIVRSAENRCALKGISHLFNRCYVLLQCQPAGTYLEERRKEDKENTDSFWLITDAVFLCKNSKLFCQNVQKMLAITSSDKGSEFNILSTLSLDNEP